MRTTVSAIIVLGLAALLPGGPQPGPPGRDAIERAVLEVHAQATRAAQARDIDRLFGYMLENRTGSVIQNGKILWTRQDALDQVRSNMEGIASIEYRWNRQEVTVVSPTVAILAAEGISNVTTTQGAAFSAPFAQTEVYVLTDGAWKILHAHQSSPRQ